MNRVMRASVLLLAGLGGFGCQTESTVSEDFTSRDGGTCVIRTSFEEVPAIAVNTPTFMDIVPVLGHGTLSVFRRTPSQPTSQWGPLQAIHRSEREPATYEAHANLGENCRLVFDMLRGNETEVTSDSSQQTRSYLHFQFRDFAFPTSREEGLKHPSFAGTVEVTHSDAVLKVTKLKRTAVKGANDRFEAMGVQDLPVVMTCQKKFSVKGEDPRFDFKDPWLLDKKMCAADPPNEPGSDNYRCLRFHIEPTGDNCKIRMDRAPYNIEGQFKKISFDATYLRASGGVSGTPRYELRVENVTVE